MEITVHTTMATWLVELATEGALGRDPGWAARQVWENIQAGQAMRGQVREPSGHDPGWAARHVWENSQAGQATMRGQVREPTDHGWGEARWIVFNPAQVIQVSEPDR
jgi:hypothetical protein